MAEEEGIGTAHALHRRSVLRILDTLVIFEPAVINGHQETANLWYHTTLSCQHVELKSVVDQAFKKRKIQVIWFVFKGVDLRMRPQLQVISNLPRVS